jgi:hypothetical protein
MVPLLDFRDRAGAPTFDRRKTVRRQLADRKAASITSDPAAGRGAGCQVNRQGRRSAPSDF